jgi:predicted MFS family arabinose efflux permease
MMAFGGLGAFVAGSPAEMLLAAGVSWRALFLCLSAASVLGAVVMLIVMPDGGAGRRENARDLLVGLGRIFANRLFWGVAPLSIASCGSAFALQGLWAGPWLGQVAHLPPAEIGYHLSAMALALLAGSLACGPLSAAAERLGVSLLGAVAALGLCFIVAFTGLVLQLTQLSLVLWAALGFLTNPMSMGYLAVAGRFPPTMAGRVTTAMNALVLAGSFVVQTFIGAMLDLWRPLAPGVYPPEAFEASFAAIWAATILAWIWFAFSIRNGQWRSDEKGVGGASRGVLGSRKNDSAARRP